jgi:hypothetical protein
VPAEGEQVLPRLGCYPIPRRRAAGNGQIERRRGRLLLLNGAMRDTSGLARRPAFLRTLCCSAMPCMTLHSAGSRSKAFTTATSRFAICCFSSALPHTAAIFRPLVKRNAGDP